MDGKSFRDLQAEARQHDDYWIELAILEVTEEVTRRMDELAISRAELARRLGTSPAYVTKILRGDANFTLATIVKLARALGCDASFRFAPRTSRSTGWEGPTQSELEPKPRRSAARRVAQATREV